MRIRQQSFIAASISVLFVGLWAAHAHAIAINYVPVGNPGNANDSATGNLYGSVAQEFWIMKYEFTNTEYAAFLNAIDPEGTNPNSVYLANMGSSQRGGITNTGTTNGNRYAVKSNMGNKPVNFVDWWAVARVANWLHNGGLTYGTTDATASAPQNNGAYTLGTANSGEAPPRNAGAQVYIPTENQWYKAAYYNPTLNGGAGGYLPYGNGFDSFPTFTTATNVTGNGTAGGTGNFTNGDNKAIWDGVSNVTTVGTNGGASFYGLFDMTGNVWEWNDLTGASTGNSRRGNRGGSFRDNATNNPQNYSSSGTGRGVPTTDYEFDNIGFRLAAVPEPSTLAMASGAAVVALVWARRRRATLAKAASHTISG